mgnify:CR=1 FL=1
MFKEMYEDIFQLCQNTEKVMNMYSKELAQLDHNTAEYMVDEMQKDLDEARSIIRDRNFPGKEVSPWQKRKPPPAA